MNPTTIGAPWIVFGTSLIALSDNCVTGVPREIGLWQFLAPFFARAVRGDVVSLRMAGGMGLIVIAGALAIWTGARARPRR